MAKTAGHAPHAFCSDRGLLAEAYSPAPPPTGTLELRHFLPHVHLPRCSFPRPLEARCARSYGERDVQEKRRQGGRCREGARDWLGRSPPHPSAGEPELAGRPAPNLDRRASHAVQGQKW